MASNGLEDFAKRGRCRICYRTRETVTHVKAVGEVRHGYATGHIWECIDVDECENVAKERVKNNHPKGHLIEIGLRQGRFKNYVIKS